MISDAGVARQRWLAPAGARGQAAIACIGGFPCAWRSLGADDDGGDHVSDDRMGGHARPQIAELFAGRGRQCLNDRDIGQQILRQVVLLFLS